MYSLYDIKKHTTELPCFKCIVRPTCVVYDGFRIIKLETVCSDYRKWTDVRDELVSELLKNHVTDDVTESIRETIRDILIKEGENG